jgi:hypothetical protein
MAIILLDDTQEAQPRMTWGLWLTLLAARIFIVAVLLLEVYLVAGVLQ